VAPGAPGTFQGQPGLLNPAPRPTSRNIFPITLPSLAFWEKCFKETDTLRCARGVRCACVVCRPLGLCDACVHAFCCRCLLTNHASHQPPPAHTHTKQTARSSPSATTRTRSPPARCSPTWGTSPRAFSRLRPSL
jgi:hypothetical protein